MDVELSNRSHGVLLATSPTSSAMTLNPSSPHNAPVDAIAEGDLDVPPDAPPDAPGTPMAASAPDPSLADPAPVAKDWTKGVWDAWNSTAGGIAQGLGTALGTTGKALGTALESTKETVGNTVGAVVEGTTQTVGNALETTTQTVGNVVKGTAQTVGNVVENTTQTMGNTVGTVVKGTAQTVGTVGNVVKSTPQAVGHVLETTGKTLGNVAETTGQGVSSALGATTQTLGTMAEETWKNSQQLAVTALETTGEVLTTTLDTTGKVVVSVTKNATAATGHVVEAIKHNPQLKPFVQSLKADIFLNIIEQVNVQEAAAAVAALRQQYPQDSPNDIAHRLIQQKVLLVGASGLVSSLVPGAALGMFTLDMAATTLVQAEMGYQIAAAYGLDLQDPARKGEILAIFGAAFGTSYALKTGLKYVLRSVPIAGAVVGASTNAMSLYAVGYAACRFYENHGLALTSEDAAQASLAAGEAYLEQASQQQLLVDQVLAHVVHAKYPDRPWAEILPHLEPYALSPQALETIATYPDNPTPLAHLLADLHPDYALAALTIGQTIAGEDGILNPQEAAILTQLQATLPHPTPTIEGTP